MDLGSQALAKFGSAIEALGEWARDHSLRLAAALTVAVAIPLAVLLYFEFRLVTDLGASSALLLEQFSQQANTDIATGIEDALKTPRTEMVARIPPGDIEPLNARNIETALGQALARDREQLVRRYYVWSNFTNPPRGRMLAFDREHDTLYEDPPETAALLQSVRAVSDSKQVVNFAFPLTIDGRRAYVQARIRYRDSQHRQIGSFLAFSVGADHFREVFLPALVAQLARRWQSPAGFPPLAVTLVDATNRTIVPAAGHVPAHYVHEERLPLVFFGEEFFEVVTFGGPFETVRLLTGYGDRTIADIVAGRQRPQRAVIMVLACVMAIGVLLVARVAAREMRLAQLKSYFVLSVSHDLKTPLALIKLFAETLELQRVKSEERRREYYSIINSEANKLARLIDNILDFSRSEAGLRLYDLEPADLAVVTAHVLESLDNQIRQNHFRVTSAFAPALPLALVDQAAAVQAIENLLSNAMKYSPDRREIEVRVDASEGCVRVQVVDHGIGIPSRLHRKIFRKFYRVKNDARSGSGGCGLGLAIVDHVMRAHHGAVRIDSQPGRGSTFTLLFPACAGELECDKADSDHRRRAADVARSA